MRSRCRWAFSLRLSRSRQSASSPCCLTAGDLSTLGVASAEALAALTAAVEGSAAEIAASADKITASRDAINTITGNLATATGDASAVLSGAAVTVDEREETTD